MYRRKLAVLVATILLVSVSAQGEEPEFDNHKFLAELREKYTDFNWVDLEKDIVLIGQLEQVEFCKLLNAEYERNPHP